VKQGRTIRELAQVCGIDPDGLEQTVRAFNDHARKGEDPEFGRGQTAYNRLQGDAAQTPNPCVAPIEAGPFLAVRVVPGCFGAFAGLKTNESAQVLRPNGTAIAGLYAAGADMRSVFGGHYPAGGINLGPAMTFGFVAARHAVGAP
jgi:succinate dehydrogenase/fumarate reductase flavoprotein subunit